MKGNGFIKKLSPYLFWDVDVDNVDAERNAPFIVQRVLEYGQLSDWNIIYSHYGLDSIISTAKDLRSLDPKAMSLLCCLGNLPETDFRCHTTKQSAPRHWNF